MKNSMWLVAQKNQKKLTAFRAIYRGVVFRRPSKKEKHTITLKTSAQPSRENHHPNTGNDTIPIIQKQP
jgi:hypothetical protein